jgi:membrane-bound metal-dependent hydrolase YbcI (DUF457 family)
MPVGLLSAGLCGMAGMLPDIDSSSSRSFQECIYFAAGLCAVMVVERFRFFGFDHNVIMLSGAAAFLFVRFAVGGLVKKLTVHRGMFHSIPAAILTGELVFCLSSGDFGERVVKSFAIVSGYLSHLILDEICSVDCAGKKIRLKQSFGTALKFYDSKHIVTALVLYILVIFIGAGTLRNPDLMVAAENNTSQTVDQTFRKSIRNLLRYAAGFDNNRRNSDNESDGQKFTRRRNRDTTNTATTSTNTTSTATNTAVTSSNTLMSTIPLSPELLQPPVNAANQNPDVQIYTQYRNRRNRQTTPTQTAQPETAQLQPIILSADTDNLPLMISREEDIAATNNTANDNDLVPLNTTNQNTPTRQRSISPNRLPVILNNLINR